VKMVKRPTMKVKRQLPLTASDPKEGEIERRERECPTVAGVSKRQQKNQLKQGKRGAAESRQKKPSFKSPNRKNTTTGLGDTK